MTDGREGHGGGYTKGGVVLEEWRDDGSEEWDDIYERAKVRPVRVPPERPRM